MKVNRVDGISRLPDRDAKDHGDPNAKRRFAIAPSLENDGNPSAEEKEEKKNDSDEATSSEPGVDIAYKILTSPFAAEERNAPHALSSKESSEELLTKIQRANRLNLHF